MRQAHNSTTPSNDGMELGTAECESGSAVVATWTEDGHGAPPDAPSAEAMNLDSAANDDDVSQLLLQFTLLLSEEGHLAAPTDAAAARRLVDQLRPRLTLLPSPLRAQQPDNTEAQPTSITPDAAAAAAAESSGKAPLGAAAPAATARPIPAAVEGVSEPRPESSQGGEAVEYQLQLRHSCR